MNLTDLLPEEATPFNVFSFEHRTILFQRHETLSFPGMRPKAQASLFVLWNSLIEHTWEGDECFQMETLRILSNDGETLKKWSKYVKYLKIPKKDISESGKSFTVDFEICS
jgi:hypothetical protein